jgi:hypothetical protein
MLVGSSGKMGRAGKSMSFPVQIHLASQVCLDGGKQERTEGAGEETRNTKTSCDQFLSQGSLIWQQMVHL